MSQVRCLMLSILCIQKTKKVHKEFGRILDRNAQLNSAFRFTTLSIIYPGFYTSHHIIICSAAVSTHASLPRSNFTHNDVLDVIRQYLHTFTGLSVEKLI
jgi:hypothetical protein